MPQPPFESESACVLYDPASGEIVHVHRVMTLQGGSHPSAEQVEARARLLAERSGARKQGLEALLVDPARLQPGTRYLVDVVARSLLVAAPALG
jgi:hypothetical protein